MSEVAKNSLPRLNDLYFHGLKNCWKRNIVRMERRKANWIAQILRKNCLLKHVIDGKIKGKGKRRIRRKQLLDDLRKPENTGA